MKTPYNYNKNVCPYCGESRNFTFLLLEKIEKDEIKFENFENPHRMLMIGGIEKVGRTYGCDFYRCHSCGADFQTMNVQRK